MNAVAEPPTKTATHSARTANQLAPESSGATYAIGFLTALGLHALILFGVRKADVYEQAEFAVEAADASVEVALVAALPAEEPAPVETPPPEPEPVPTPPTPEPMPEPPPVEPPPAPEKPPEMTIPEPAPTPPPKPKRAEPPRPQAPKPQPRPTAPRPVGDGSAAVPGNDATSAMAAAGAASARPGYLSNPHPAYPEAARAARQQGVVSLRISVDAEGRVTGVRVARSSGFPLLDERAQSTVSQRWRFKPAKVNGVAVATSVVVPIRFTLDK